VTLEKTHKIVPPAPDTQILQESVDQIAQQMDVLQGFIKRRFDEISMEINATSQQMGMVEEGIGKQFGDILQILGAISYSGSGNTQVNAGVELEAVIEDTEQAANTILDAADRIAVRIGQEDWSQTAQREKALSDIRQDIQEILMACTFQDLTGQRIRRTLENLALIETRLTSTLERLGIDVTPSSEEVARFAEGDQRFAQNDIDALFSTARPKE
jgi:chemotaxis protein CheZ